jgi:transposase-like protein
LPPPYQRDVTEREQAVQALLESGYSPNAIKRTLHALNLHYNPDEPARLKQKYLELYKCWQNRQLPEDVIAIFIDACLYLAIHATMETT